MAAARGELRDGMRIEWDVPIVMDDGLVLRADVYRAPPDGRLMPAPRGEAGQHQEEHSHRRFHGGKARLPSR